VLTDNSKMLGGVAGAVQTKPKATKKTKKVMKRVVRKVAVAHAFQNIAATGVSA